MPKRILVCLLAFVIAAPTFAAEAFWNQFVDHQTLAVATAQLDGDALPGLTEEIKRYSPEPAEKVGDALAALREAGVAEAALALGVPDVQTLSGPIIALRLRHDADATAAADRLDQLFAKLGWPRNTRESIDIRSSGQTLLVGKRRAIDRYSEPLVCSPREDLSAALEEAGDDAAFTVALSPDATTRRVLRELWPELPSPWDALTGALVADGAKHATLSLSLDPVGVRFALATPNEASARQWERLASQGIAVGAESIAAMEPSFADVTTQMTQAIGPFVDGSKVVVALRGGTPMTDGLLKDVLPMMSNRLNERALRNARMNTVKQLGLAMLNFESANGFFPAMAAVRDADGRPLLSWRVAVLPYMEEGVEAFRRFHLDEPWDSPHNLALAKEMPDVYANPTRPDLNRQGLTVYQVPVGPNTIFPIAENAELIERARGMIAKGHLFRDVVDGASNTFMVVEVASDQAVPWTKPADWEVDVDVDDIMAALRQEGRTGFATVFADGAARIVPFEIAPAEVRKSTTRNGGETLDHSKW